MGKILWPNGTTERPVISSAFGPRNLANPLASTNHRGVDLIGFPTVHAIADGTVVFVGWYSAVGWSPIAGFMVWVQHDGFFTRSLHTDPATVRVRKGDRVKAGDPLVDKGWSGLAHPWDEHLHLEVTPGPWHTSNYGQVDPIGFIQARLITGAPANVPESNESEEDPMPKHEHKAYSGDQSLGRRGGWWPLQVSGTKQKPEHRFAATGDGQSETGDVVLTVTFGRGGTPGQELAQVRIRHQEKVGTKWVDRELTEPLDVIATAGGTTVQYALPYNLGPNYRSMVLAAGLIDDVKIAKVAYRKNYWRS